MRAYTNDELDRLVGNIVVNKATGERAEIVGINSKMGHWVVLYNIVTKEITYKDSVALMVLYIHESGKGCYEESI